MNVLDKNSIDLKSISTALISLCEILVHSKSSLRGMGTPVASSICTSQASDGAYKSMNFLALTLEMSSSLLKSLYVMVFESYCGYSPHDGVCVYFFSSRSWVKLTVKNLGKFLKQL